MEKNTGIFLESVAQYLLEEGSDHRNTLLLFPNKRAVIFMRRYLKLNTAKPVFMPRLRTFGAFTASVVGLQEASRIEQLFTLYDAYCEVCNDYDQSPSSFDRFRFWGELILDDFEDVDLQGADAEALFTNLKRLHEIQTDFLDEEQRKVAMEIWGHDPWTAFEGFKESRRAKDDDDIVFNSYKRLTEIMYPIYESFHRRLEERGLTTRGRISRKASEILDGEDLPALPAIIMFVGFGVLSKTEKKIFRALQKRGVAQFFWDIPDMLTRDVHESMGKYQSPLKKYIDRLVKDFPMPPTYVQPEEKNMPEIRVLGVTSNTMQAKVCGNIIDKLHREKNLDTSRVDNTVVVLPNTSLLIPLLHSLRVSPVNITMGLPIRNTPFATLLGLVIRLNMSARTDADGDTIYLTQNVVQIISHPSLTVLLPKQTDKLRTYFKKNGRFVTKVKKIEEEAPELGFIFRRAPEDDNLEEAKTFILGLIDGMTALIRSVTGGEKDDLDNSALHEYRVLRALRDAVDNLVNTIAHHPLVCAGEQSIGALTFVRLVEKQLFKEQINFSGSPLVGLQIMGTLETRSLDFDNVIMLSLNEKTFPPRNILRSTLPLSLRGVFGLTMPEKRELEYAWIYANLMSRCKRAFLLYDTAGESVGSGGISRYLFQTRYIYNRPVPKVINISPSGTALEQHQISVVKTEAVREELKHYLSGGDRELSVSSLETFAACPLRFYLSKVKRVDEQRQSTEAIDAMALGNMVHNALEQIYLLVEKTNGGIMDERFEITDEAIRQILVEELSKEWYGGIYDMYGKLPQQAQIQVDLWSRKVSEIIKLERTREDGPYTFVANELSQKSVNGKEYFDWEINPDLKIRFTFYVDRVDRLSDGQLRFIDYKTGTDVGKASSFEHLFGVSQGDETKMNKVFFQLLTYAHAYEEVLRQNGQKLEQGIILELTSVLDPARSVGQPLTINKVPIEDHRSEIVADFLPRLKAMIEKIFDPEEPFTQTPNEQDCFYCQFKNICQRNPQKKF